MGEEKKKKRRQTLSTSILKRCQEIGSATGMRWSLGLSLVLNVLLILALAMHEERIGCVNCHYNGCNVLLQTDLRKIILNYTLKN